MMGVVFLSGGGWAMNKMGDFKLYESGALKTTGIGIRLPGEFGLLIRK